MALDADRPHSRSPTPMRNAKRFVQVQMAYIGTEVARPADSNLRIHIRSVHINLPARSMHDVANLRDSLFEDSMGRWIGNHKRSQIGGILLRLLSKIRHVDIALVIAFHNDYPHTA